MVRPATNALRLTFVYRNGSLELQSRMGVNAMVPPADSAAPGTEEGFWVELRDGADRAVFHRVMHDPLPADREVFSPDPTRSIARSPGERAEHVFSVLVPNPPEAQSIALFSSHHEPVPKTAQVSGAARSFELRAVLHANQGSAREIARFPLDDNG